MSSEKLKLCPFCGGEARIIKKTWDKRMPNKFWGNCKECGVMTCSYPTEAEAIKAWNRRPK